MRIDPLPIPVDPLHTSRRHIDPLPLAGVYATDGNFHPVPRQANDWLTIIISISIVTAVTHLVGLTEN